MIQGLEEVVELLKQEQLQRHVLLEEEEVVQEQQHVLLQVQ